MKRFLKVFLFIVASLLFSTTGYAAINGGITGQNYFKLNSSALLPVNSSWTIGSSSDRVDIYGGTIDTNILSVGTAVSGAVTIKADDANALLVQNAAGDTNYFNVDTSSGGILVGGNGANGSLGLYSEQGGTDYTATLLPNAAMTSDASFYLPADEPAGTYLLNMTTGGVIGYDTSTYLTAETDPIVGAITGIVKADGGGNISAASDGTDYISSLVVDTTPQLGGDLDVNGHSIVANDTWLTAVDNAGTGTVNMFKVNTSDTIDIGASLNIGTIDLTEDSGAVTLIDLPVSATPVAGTEESYSFAVDATGLLTVYAEADGTGGIQNSAIKVLTDLNVGANDLEITGSIASTGSRVTKGWFTDLEVTNSIAGSITGTATNLSGTPALPNGTTATTQSASDNSTKLATTAYVDAAVGGGGATTALDNLASVAINTSLISDTDNTDALGSAAISWSDLYLGSGAVITFSSAPSTPDVTLTYSADTLALGGGNLALGANNLTMTGSIADTTNRVTKGWFTDLEVTNAPTVGGSAVYYSGGTDVAVADGGTGKSSWTQYLIPYADTTTSFGQIAIGTSGQVLTSNGAGAAPTFQDAAAGGTTIKSGVTTRDVSQTTSQNIAHGLGATPSYVEITVFSGTDSNGEESFGWFDGTNTTNIARGGNGSLISTSYIVVINTDIGDYAMADISVDGTNITLDWNHKAGSPSGTAAILWKAW